LRKEQVFTPEVDIATRLKYAFTALDNAGFNNITSFLDALFTTNFPVGTTCWQLQKDAWEEDFPQTVSLIPMCRFLPKKPERYCNKYLDIAHCELESFSILFPVYSVYLAYKETWIRDPGQLQGSLVIWKSPFAGSLNHGSWYILALIHFPFFTVRGCHRGKWRPRPGVRLTIWLEYLKEHYPGYRDIEIDRATLN
jgi:hypothetical protein